MKRTLLLLCVIYLTCCAIGAVAVEYQIVDLGLGYGYGINNLGQVVGMRADDTGRVRACIWQNGSVTDLEDIDGPTSRVPDVGQAINNSGCVAGTANYSKALIWDANGTPADAGTLGGGQPRVTGLNDNGDIVGYSGIQQVYFRNHDGTLTHVLGMDFSGEVNNSGQVVGTTATRGTAYSMLWDNGNVTELRYSSTSATYAQSINNAGQVAGQYKEGSNWGGFIWQGGVFTTLNLLPGNTYGGAYDVNNLGQVVGESAVNSSSTLHPVIWDENGVATELESLSPGHTAGVYAINDQGIIAGCATDADGKFHAVVWQPVPEPTSLLVLLPGLAGIGALARRKSR